MAFVASKKLLECDLSLAVRTATYLRRKTIRENVEVDGVPSFDSQIQQSAEDEGKCKFEAHCDGNPVTGWVKCLGNGQYEFCIRLGTETAPEQPQQEQQEQQEQSAAPPQEDVQTVSVENPRDTPSIVQAMVQHLFSGF